MKTRQKFRGTLVPDGTGLNWTVVRVPFDPVEAWPERNRLRVRGSINGFEFRTSLFRTRDGGYILLVNRQMQKGGRVTQGSVAEVVLEPDLEERRVGVPAELDKVLRQDRALRKWHDALSDSMRKAIADAITQPKSAEARVGRAELWAERMLLAMDGERVTPPVLERAFRKQADPGAARAGWAGMTPIQRRSHLMGIFYYQSPESREKRAQKAMDEALRIAGKKPAPNRS